MNWDAIGAVGEIIGALAVIVTLLYLARQVRQNTAAVAATTYDSLLNSFASVNALVISDPAVADLFDRGNRDPASLSDAEAIRYGFLLRSWANQWLKAYRLYQRGAITQEEWGPIAEDAGTAFSTPGGRLFREENGVFEELWKEIDRHPEPRITRVRLGESLASPDGA